MTVTPDPLRAAKAGTTVGTILRQDPDLELRYEEYRRRQARALVSILPRESVRPLYAHAREWGRTGGLEVDKDPLATLLLFVQHLLPLPPVDVWMKDRLRNLDAHLREEFESPQAQSRTSPPVMVESKRMEMEGRWWRAALHLFRRDGAWRGFITFHSGEDDEAHRTADIFREDDPEAIRARFLGLHPHTLQAFLRSVSPG